MKDANSHWFIIPKANPQAALRLFCLPYSGSGAFAFRTWPEKLLPQVELCAVQLPGRENRLRERPFTDIAPLVEAVVAGIVPYLDRPFAVFGHSLGALIAFELCRALRRCSYRSPEALLVSGRGSPQSPVREAPVHELPDAEFIERLREFNGTPEAVLGNRELMLLLLPVLRADFAVNETYRYRAEPPLSCPISAYRGARDPNMTYEDVAAWQEETSGAFTLRTLPGDHFFIHSAADLFWRMLNHDLSQAFMRTSHPVAGNRTLVGAPIS